MDKSHINIMIVGSFIMLVVAFLINPPYKSNSITTQITPIPSPTTKLDQVKPTSYATNDPKVNCANNFYPVYKWKRQRYSITVINSSSKKTQKQTLTNSIADIEKSSVTIVSSLEAKVSYKVKIECRSSGVYGLPFAPEILLSANKKIQLPIINMLTKQFLMLPPGDELVSQKNWRTKISLKNIAVGILQDVNITLLLNTKLNKSTRETLNGKMTDVVYLEQSLIPELDSIKMAMKDRQIRIYSKYAKEIGLIKYTIKTSDGKKTSEVIIDLLDSF